MELPPGIVFIVYNLPRILLPPALAYSGIRIWDIVFAIPFPEWLRIPLYLFSLPLALTCSVFYADWRDRRQAALHGAVLAPRATSRWPGGLDTLARNVQNFRSGYMGMSKWTICLSSFAHRLPGEILEEQCKEHGQTVNIRVLFENRVSLLHRCR